MMFISILAQNTWPLVISWLIHKYICSYLNKPLPTFSILFWDQLLEKRDVFEQQKNQHYRVVVGLYRCNMYEQPHRRF